MIEDVPPPSESHAPVDAATPADAGAAVDDDVTGLPALRSWTAVYVFVVAIFVAYVILLTALSRAFA